MRKLTTIRGYTLLDVASALQKAIRRADARLAGYWAIELFESGYREYLWRRLLTISAEDCWGLITAEIEALYRSWQVIDRQKKGGGRIFPAKATLLLAMARKCRDADHLTNFVYDPAAIEAAVLEADLAAARAQPEDIPDYAFDCHTAQGRKAGKTKEEFFDEEYRALQPRQRGLFDEEVDSKEDRQNES
jgi:replication-associated recombination protein RarA